MIDLQRFMRSSAKDLAGVQAEFVRIKGGRSLASPNLSGSAYIIPADKLLVLQSVIAELTPGAAQTALSARLSIYPDQVYVHFAAVSVDPAVPAARPLYLSMLPNEIIVPCIPALTEGHIMYFADFNAGVAANNAWFHLTGWLIPRGSVAI